MRTREKSSPESVEKGALFARHRELCCADKGLEYKTHKRIAGCFSETVAKIINNDLVVESGRGKAAHLRKTKCVRPI